ncbi:MAG: hypothetical protein V3U92_13880 [Cellulophaga sp.]
MKAKSILLIAIILLCNSCILKSLQPFYIAKAIAYEKLLIGEWQDNNKNQWAITSLEDKFKQEQKDSSSISKEEIQFFKKHEKGYFISYTKDNKVTEFIAMPFKINNQILLDVMLFEFDNGLNNLTQNHLLPIHSVAKIDLLPNNEIVITWLAENNVLELIREGKIKIKHEIMGILQNLILTENSEDLYNFLTKYVTAKDETIWSKTYKYKLVRSSTKTNNNNEN